MNWRQYAGHLPTDQLPTDHLLAGRLSRSSRYLPSDCRRMRPKSKCDMAIVRFLTDGATDGDSHGDAYGEVVRDFSPPSPWHE